MEAEAWAGHPSALASRQLKLPGAYPEKQWSINAFHGYDFVKKKQSMRSFDSEMGCTLSGHKKLNIFPGAPQIFFFFRLSPSLGWSRPGRPAARPGWAGQSQSGLQILENWVYWVFQRFYWFYIGFYLYFLYSHSISRHFQCFACFSNGFPYMLL